MVNSAATATVRHAHAHQEEGRGMQRYALGQRLAAASAGGCGDSMFAATSTGSQADTFARPCNLSIPAPETKSDDAGGVLEGTGFQDVDPNSLGWDDEDDADDELSLVQSLYGAFFQPSELTTLRREFYKTASSGMMTIKDAEDLFITAQFMDEHAVQEENLVRNLHLALANTRTVCMLIRKAEGVVSKDSNGLSDPFAVVLVDGKPSHSSVNGGKAYGQTQVVYKTLDPVWEEQVTFDIQKHAKTITVALYDSDDFGVVSKISTEYMGSFDLDLQTIAPVQEQWHTLQCDEQLDPKRSPVAGRILVHHEIQGDMSKSQTDPNDLDEVKLSFSDAVRILYKSRSEGAQKHVPKPPLFPFDPESPGKQMWDLFIMLLLLFTTFAVPYMLAFGEEIDKTQPLDVYQIFDLILDGLFCVDIVISFCTAYIHQGMYITSMPLIAKNYLAGWFWIDVPGSVPVDKIITYTTSGQNMGSTLKALKFIRILKMVRAVRFLNKLTQLEEKDVTGSLRTVLKVFRSLFLMMFSAHFLGCMFVLLRDQTMQDSEDIDNWMDQYDSDLRNKDNVQKYIVCLYWAIATVSTIGYGDVLPVNHTERTYGVLVALIGVVIFGFAMGNITTLLASATGARLRFDDKLRAAQEYLSFRSVGTTLKRRITTHIGGPWRESGDLHEELHLLDSLPRHLRKTLLEHLSAQAERDIPMLKGLDLESAGMIYVLLEPVHFLEQEVCYMARELGGNMYFIVKGSVNLIGSKVLIHDESATSSQTVYRPKDLRKSQTREGGGTEPYFGELSLFEEVCSVRTEEAKATSAVETFCLTRGRLNQVRHFCPEFYDFLYDFCRLSAACVGITNKWITQNAQGSHSYPKIKQLCIDLRKELMSRHQQILQKQQASDTFNLPSLSESDSKPSSFNVMKKTNLLGHREERIIVLDKNTECMVNLEPDVTVVTGNSAKGSFSRRMDVEKKSFPVEKIEKVETFEKEGASNLTVVIHFLGEGKQQRPYDLEFQNQGDKSGFMSALSQMIKQHRDRQHRQTPARGGSARFAMTPLPSGSPLRTMSPGGSLVGSYYEVAFFCDNQGKLVHHLPGEEDSSRRWTKGCFSVLPELSVRYMIDNVDLLIESAPSILGTIVVNDTKIEQTCTLLEAKPTSNQSGGDHQYLCLFWVHGNTHGERKLVTMGFHSKKEAASIRSEILTAARRFKQSERFLGEKSGPASIVHRQEGDTKERAIDFAAGEEASGNPHTALSRTLGHVLKDLNMTEYASHFAKAHIDNEALALMGREDFSKLNLPLGHEIKIWSALLKVGAVSERANRAGMSAAGVGGEQGGGGGEAGTPEAVQRALFEWRAMRWELQQLRSHMQSSANADVGRVLAHPHDQGRGIDHLPPDQLPPYNGVRTNL